MSLRDELAGVLARDPRYPIHAYVFVFEALEHAKALKATKVRTRAPRGQTRTQSARRPGGHITGRELCEGARDLALRQYGLMALAVLAQWGIRSTSDLGEIVYNLIAAGDLEKTPTDARSDFDHVFDFESAFRRDYVLALDDVA
jgi:uncharacterized repeat protein (TIGR04138 family)